MNDDLISREDLKKYKFTTQVCNGVEIESVEVVGVATIDNAPPIEDTPVYRLWKQAYERGKAERPQGEWIIVKDERYGDNVKCPFCEKELAGTDLNFCCKCGASMRGGERT